MHWSLSVILNIYIYFSRQKFTIKGLIFKTLLTFCFIVYSQPLLIVSTDPAPTRCQGQRVPHIHISLHWPKWMVGHTHKDTKRESQKYCCRRLYACAFICASTHVHWGELWPALTIKTTRESTYIASLRPFPIFPSLPVSVLLFFFLC